ncbi:MAG: 50S ribosomal protein L24 [Patescibacteria group bacterium]
MKIKKGDNILVISGKDVGKTAKILKSLPREGKVLVEGVNLGSRHLRPKRQGEKGQVVKIPMPLDASNVKFICPKCGKATRLGYKIVGDLPAPAGANAGGQAGKKFRVCKKCKSEI